MIFSLLYFILPHYLNFFYSHLSIIKLFLILESVLLILIIYQIHLIIFILILVIFLYKLVYSFIVDKKNVKIITKTKFVLIENIIS